MKLTPDFKIEVNGKEATATVKKHLSSLSLTDEAGGAADALELRFDNLYQRPAYRDKIRVWLGYRERGLYFCGAFFVQTTQRTQSVLTVRATSADFFVDLKAKRNRSFENLTLCDLVRKIAAENDLKSRCDFNDVFLKHLSQTNESDLHLLTRLAQSHHAVFNVKNGTLIFVKRGLNPSLPLFVIDRRDVLGYSIKHADKTLYASVKAVWHDTKANAARSVLYRAGDPCYRLPGSFKSKEEALKKAQGAFKMLNAGTISGRLQALGDNVIAGGRLMLTGFGEDDGEYAIKRVTHTLNDGGYTLDVEFENG